MAQPRNPKPHTRIRAPRHDTPIYHARLFAAAPDGLRIGWRLRIGHVVSVYDFDRAAVGQFRLGGPAQFASAGDRHAADQNGFCITATDAQLVSAILLGTGDNHLERPVVPAAAITGSRFLLLKSSGRIHRGKDLAVPQYVGPA